MTDLLAPLVPANCNLGDFPFMPLDVRRLLSSETWILGTGEERAAAMCLWLESWHQVPAASLPDNDRMLSHLAKCSKWGKVREHALRGWVRCSDGRLYHAVVAEKALEAWIEKLLNRYSGAAGNAKRWQIDVDTDGIKEELLHAVKLLKNIAPESKALKKKALLQVISASPPDSPPEEKPVAPRHEKKSPPDSPPDRKRQRQGQGLVNPISEIPTSTTEPLSGGPPPEPSSSASSDGKAAPGPDPERCQVVAQRIVKLEAQRGKTARIFASDTRVQAWVAAGIRDPELREAYELAVAQRIADRDDTPINAGFLDRFVAKVLNPKGVQSAVTAMARAWHETATGVEAKAKELGVKPYHPDDYPHGWQQFKAAVMEAAGLAETEEA